MSAARKVGGMNLRRFRGGQATISPAVRDQMSEKAEAHMAEKAQAERAQADGPRQFEAKNPSSRGTGRRW